ncbi:DUF1801 domain-containing protein [Fulvivirgaceae bacterium PWU4]|uniref:DUF1801 domain-containing protein n=1 Tax=Chryseosolibacter histidini TaxID=2782349 RepID=A0AAP2DIH0_9BACT|nr:DUF1801 domain-containing protein [Chryseosolibacter histidini]MBT1696993.1 DUF1801 domain-containing protein [Chryseosolibacter histidini]
MASEKIKFETADQYISSFPKDVQAILQKVRKTIQKAVPEAEEVISYNIPAFKFNGWVFYYSAYTNHFSLSCPPPFTIFDKFKKELAGYEQSKSAIRFPLDQPVPTTLIADMAKFRAQQNTASEAKKKVKKK